MVARTQAPRLAEAAPLPRPVAETSSAYPGAVRHFDSFTARVRMRLQHQFL